MINFGTQFSQLASGFWWLLPLPVLLSCSSQPVVKPENKINLFPCR